MPSASVYPAVAARARLSPSACPLPFHYCQVFRAGTSQYRGLSFAAKRYRTTEIRLTDAAGWIWEAGRRARPTGSRQRLASGRRYRQLFSRLRAKPEAGSGIRCGASVLDEVMQPIGQPTTLQFPVHQRARRAGEQLSEGVQKQRQPPVDQFDVALRVVVEPA